MERIIKRRADEVVHRGVHNDEILFARALHVFHLGHQRAGIANDEATRLNQNFQAERFQQRQ